MEKKKHFFTVLGWMMLFAIALLLFVWKYGIWLSKYIDASQIIELKQILVWIVAIGFLVYMYDTKLFHS